MSDNCWGGTLSEDGRIQVLQEQLAAANRRANAAEVRVARVRQQVDEWMRDYGPESRANKVFGQQRVSIAFLHEEIHRLID
ncbi:hypothetical protein SEA_NANOSMITE_78 [Mycobacterium phage Nanosmite]|nr:hypothetical protein SEA_NANOSMITE_78 [Mycobacterium phage Nanosmite]